MSKRQVLVVLFVCLLASASTALAEQDFYGVRMADAVWARSMVYGAQEKPDLGLLSKGPVVDHALHAEASLKEMEEGKLALRITVFNESGEPVATDYRYRDFFIYARDGKRYSLIDTENDLDLAVIPAKGKALFSPSAGNLILRNRDVTMIECSFDLGRTRIFLFPWSKKDAVSKLKSPAKPIESAPVKEFKRKAPEPAKNQEKAVVEVKQKEEPKTESRPVKVSEPVPAKASLSTEGPANRAPKRNFWEWLGGRGSKGNKEAAKPTLPSMPASEKAVRVDASPAAEGASSKASVANAPAPSSDGPPAKLDEAIKRFVYIPASGIEATGNAVASAPVVGPVTRGLIGEGTDRSADRVLINSETQQAFAWPPDRPTNTQRSAVEVSDLPKAAAAAPSTSTRQAASAPRAAEKAAVPYASAPPARTSAQVIEYNKDYQFITVNLGLKDGIKKGMVLGILRDGKLIAKAKVKQLREAVLAATVLKDSMRAEVLPGDAVTMA